MTATLRIADNLSLPLEAVTQTFGILAKRGSGKTYTAAVLTEELLKAHAQVVVADPIGVWWGLRAAANGRDPGLPIVVMGGDHGDVVLEVGSGKVIAEFVVEEAQSVVLDLSLFRKGGQTQFMTDFAETLYHRNREPLHLVIDEADAFAPQRPQRGQERMLGAVEDLVRRGRARGIGVTLVTQRAAVINKDVLTQIEVLVALRTISPQDRAAIDAWIQVHGTPHQQQQLNESLPSLPVGTAWFWSPGWLDVFKKVRVRARETFDSSATPKSGATRRSPCRLAKVDLVALQARIASTIERAAAEDPKALRRRIQDLEKQLAAKPVERKTVEVEVLKEAHVARLEKAVGSFVGAGEKVVQVGRELAEALRKRRNGHASPELTLKPVVVHGTFSPGTTATMRRPAPTAVASGPTEDLPRGEHRVLTAVAQHRGRVTREQLTVLTGYKRSSRDTYLQRLRERGLVDQAGDRIVTTDAGLDALGGGFVPLPMGEELRAYWMARLPVGERVILEVLITAHPNAVHRDAISAATEYKRSSRDTYLQRLRSRNLVDAVSAGEVRASDDLF